jgi:predicted amidophosphoribosyltransferase
METRVERKCDSCNQWVTGNPRICPHCSDFLDHRVREHEQKETAKVEKEAHDEAVFLSKPPLVRFLISIGNFVETVFLTITGFISFLLFWLGG